MNRNYFATSSPISSKAVVMIRQGYNIINIRMLMIACSGMARGRRPRVIMAA